MAVFLGVVSMVPIPAKTPHMFCAVHIMQKLFLDAIGGNVGQ